jgi:hypothetical protein
MKQKRGEGKNWDDGRSAVWGRRGAVPKRVLHFAVASRLGGCGLSRNRSKSVFFYLKIGTPSMRTKSHDQPSDS